MKNSRLIGFIIIVAIISCNDNQTANSKFVQNPNAAINTHNKQPNKSIIESQWDSLLFVQGGCLTGGQIVKQGQFGGMGCIMSTSKEWNNFFDSNKINEFLISKITSDTTKTKIHTCPFFNATESEVAIYALQNKHKTNWYDFKEFEQFQNREAEGTSENHQAWLQNIINNDKSRQELIECWRRKASG